MIQQITLTLKEPYQMIAVDGDIELQLFDGINPFLEGIISLVV
jgi:hypothetical protein